MKKEFKLSKFEIYVLRGIRNGGLIAAVSAKGKYECMHYDWDGHFCIIDKYLVKRLKDNGYLREVQLGIGHDYEYYYQSTEKAEDYFFNKEYSHA